ncbi:MAG: four helix bundle protein [Patescibacteria group bacterium]
MSIQNKQNSDIPIIVRLYDFYKSLSLVITSFPKIKRYTLGQKLDNVTLEIFEIVFSIPQSKEKIILLKKISVKLDLLKILLRLSKDTNAMNNKKYIELQSILQEICKMIGGWIRYSKNS